MDLFERCSQEVHRFINNINIRAPSLPTLPTMPVTAERALAAVHDKIKLRPFTTHNILYHYLPLQGLVSYSVLSIHIMHPKLLHRIFCNRDITNVLLISAGCGAGLWIWARPHLAAAAPARRFSWAFLCGSMWSLGSILLWAVVRTSIGCRPILSTLLGLSSGVVLTYTGIDYFNYVDLVLQGGIMINEDLSEATARSDDDKYDFDI